MYEQHKERERQMREEDKLREQKSRAISEARARALENEQAGWAKLQRRLDESKRRETDT